MNDENTMFFGNSVVRSDSSVSAVQASDDMHDFAMYNISYPSDLEKVLCFFRRCLRALSTHAVRREILLFLS